MSISQKVYPPLPYYWPCFWRLAALCSSFIFYPFRCVSFNPLPFLPSQGGIAFVAIKGAFKVYFKQQQYLRQAHRKILNFPEQEEAWGRLDKAEAECRPTGGRGRRTGCGEDGAGGGRERVEMGLLPGSVLSLSHLTVILERILRHLSLFFLFPLF